jgi:hypothetical protein
MRQEPNTGRAERAESAPKGESLVISYMTLRKIVGVLGFAFPVILSVGCDLFGSCTCVEPSLSDYYGTEVRDLFVGMLFAIALFLFSYTGYRDEDGHTGAFACFFAIGVALFPITSPFRWVHCIHYACAAGFFLVLAYFSLCLFTKGPKGGGITTQKKRRNRVFRACGVAILVFLVLIVLCQTVMPERMRDGVRPVFWLESLALWTFAFSWATKGQVFFKDPRSVRPAAPELAAVAASSQATEPEAVQGVEP